MAYGLRKINKDGKHYEFTWPLEVGATAICPDWDPKVECGNGLHLLTPDCFDFELLDGYYWAVCEYDPETAVIIDNSKIKVPECKIVFLSRSPDGMLEFFPGPKSNEFAFEWATYIGDAEHMKQFVTDSEYAYYWALNIGDGEHMKRFVTESAYAYYWALIIGDVEHMMQFVTESAYAYLWACDIGDIEHMKQFVTESEYVSMWNYAFPDNQIDMKCYD